MDIRVALADVADKLIAWGHGFILLTPNLVAASLVMLIAFGFSRLARSVVSKATTRATAQALLGNLLATIAQSLVLLVGIFISLGILKLDKTVTSLLAGAGVIGLALAFAFQDIASNFLAGILLAVRRPFSPGDIIKTNDFLGTVDELNLRSTHLRTPEGQIVILPNAEVFQKPIVNFSMARFRRVDLACAVAYEQDLEQAKQVALAAITALEVSDKTRPIDMFFTEFGSSGVEFTIRYWIPFSTQLDFLLARSQGIEAIKAAFDKGSVDIAYATTSVEVTLSGAEEGSASPRLALVPNRGG